MFYTPLENLLKVKWVSMSSNVFQKINIKAQAKLNYLIRDLDVIKEREEFLGFKLKEKFWLEETYF